MNILQALHAVPELTGLPPRIFEAAPRSPPVGVYAVVTELREDPEARQAYYDTQATVLVTVYGAEGMALSDLRTVYNKVKAIAGLITQHPGVGHIAGATRGACQRPIQETVTQRPWFGIRFTLNYLEAQ